MLVIGSPGTDKSMLTPRLPTILCALTSVESLETTRIHSAMGRLLPEEPLLTRRSFRIPYHTISDASMVGSGSTFRNGLLGSTGFGISLMLSW